MHLFLISTSTVQTNFNLHQPSGEHSFLFILDTFLKFIVVASDVKVE